MPFYTEYQGDATAKTPRSELSDVISSLPPRNFSPITWSLNVAFKMTSFHTTHKVALRTNNWLSALPSSAAVSGSTRSSHCEQQQCSGYIVVWFVTQYKIVCGVFLCPGRRWMRACVGRETWRTTARATIIRGSRARRCHWNEAKT